MNHESRFQEADPAKDLHPLDAAAKQRLAHHAQHSETVHEFPAGRSTKSIAVVAALVLAVSIPLAGQFNQSDRGNRLVIAGLATNQAESGMAADSIAPQNSSAMAGRMDAKVSGLMPDYRYGWWWQPEFVLDIDLPTDTSIRSAYRMDVIPNATNRIQAIAKQFGFDNLQKDGDTSFSATLGDAANYSSKSFSAYVDKSWANFYYYDQTLDPWNECQKYWSSGKEDVTGGSSSSSPPDSGGATCEPSEVKLPSNAVVKSTATQLLSDWNLNSENLKWNFYRDKWVVNVSATLLVDGIESPISWWFSFNQDTQLINGGGSLQTLTAIGDYDLISAADGYQRYKSMMNKWKAEVEAQQNSGSDANSGSSSDGSTGVVGPNDSSAEPAPSSSAVEPTKPTDQPSEPTPIDPTIEPTVEPTPVIAHITEVKLGMMTVNDAAGNLLWIPTWEFWGYYESDDSKYQSMLANVIAVRDDQIDLDQFYQNMFQIMPMARW